MTTHDKTLVASIERLAVEHETAEDFNHKVHSLLQSLKAEALRAMLPRLARLIHNARLGVHYGQSIGRSDIQFLHALDHAFELALTYFGRAIFATENAVQLARQEREDELSERRDVDALLSEGFLEEKDASSLRDLWSRAHT